MRALPCKRQGMVQGARPGRLGEAGAATLEFERAVEIGERKGIRPEANMPGWTEIARYLHVSTFADWDAVGRWYWNLVKDQLIVDAKIRAAVNEVLLSLPEGADERAKVRALYKHVITSTRYVGLEFGIHGFKPYRVTQIVRRGFGDCKDKASLLYAMFREAGIDAHIVLTRGERSELAELAANLL